MLALTKKAGYALIAMSHLAGLPGDEVASAREIAEYFGVPISLLMNVLKELSAAGYVKSVRGVHGGYRLARKPQEVNLADLLESLEGPIRLAECITDLAGDEKECTCKLMAACPIADPVHRVHRKLNDFLRKVSLAEIVEPATASIEE
ncbi:MAG: Rrf2 family transcriptional regulator [Planctomycetota bacterium]|nr:Rrf2 family transcriptional regulator [Planctomycetota bacterium]